jgi:hypothetical protein
MRICIAVTWPAHLAANAKKRHGPRQSQGQQ